MNHLAAHANAAKHLAMVAHIGQQSCIYQNPSMYIYIQCISTCATFAEQSLSVPFRLGGEAKNCKPSRWRGRTNCPESFRTGLVSFVQKVTEMVGRPVLSVRMRLRVGGLKVKSGIVHSAIACRKPGYDQLFFSAKQSHP